MSELKPVIGSPLFYTTGAILGAAIALAADLPWWAAGAIGAAFYAVAVTASRLVRARHRRTVKSA